MCSIHLLKTCISKLIQYFQNKREVKLRWNFYKQIAIVIKLVVTNKSMASQDIYIFQLIEPNEATTKT